MKKFFEAVIKLRIPILIIFVLLAGACAFMKGFVYVNYDINSYLPEDSPSTQALKEMESSFGGNIPSCRVMVQDVSMPEALECKGLIAALPGVEEIMWLDDSPSSLMPLEMMDSKTRDTYYKDGNALFNVTISDDGYIETIESIREIIGEDNAMAGKSVSNAVASTGTEDEIRRITVISVIYVFLILLLTTSSWLAPIVILIGLGVAIVINAGSNLIFGEISFVTNASGNILLLAVSLDYSVFLYHRFEDCLKTQRPEEAMVEALCKSISSIFSSGVTTIIGFLALVFMRFLIGPDLGVALAKGIIISLADVFIFMPALLLTAYPLLERSRHKSLVPDLHGFGRRVSKVMVPMAVIFALIIVPSFIGSNSNSYYFGSSHIYGEDSKVGQDTAAIAEVFGQKDTYVLMVPAGNEKQEDGLVRQLKSMDRVDDIISYTGYLGTTIPAEFAGDVGPLSKLHSDKYSRMILTVDAEYEGQKTYSLIDQIRGVAQDYFPDQWYLAGAGVSTYDLKETATADMLKVNIIAIIAVLLVLIVNMRSVIIPIILVASIETAIWINLSVPFIMGHPVFYIAYLIISSIQLGATVDYAILISDRYRENRQKLEPKEAVIETLASCTVSVLTSGSALTVVGFLMGFMCTHKLLAQLGFFLGRGALCSAVIVLFVLPGLLFVLDRFVKRR